jgi:hypothetical protein
LSPAKKKKLMADVHADGRTGEIAETKNQIRRANGLCGGEKEAEISIEEGAKEHKAKVRVRKGPSTTIGAGVIVALKSASRAWSPLQQIWLGSGACGVDGPDS